MQFLKFPHFSPKKSSDAQLAPISLYLSKFPQKNADLDHSKVMQPDLQDGLCGGVFSRANVSYTTMLDTIHRSILGSEDCMYGISAKSVQPSDIRCSRDFGGPCQIEHEVMMCVDIPDSDLGVDAACDLSGRGSPICEWGIVDGRGSTDISLENGDGNMSDRLFNDMDDESIANRCKSAEFGVADAKNSPSIETMLGSRCHTVDLDGDDAENSPITETTPAGDCGCVTDYMICESHIERMKKAMASIKRRRGGVWKGVSCRLSRNVLLGSRSVRR